MNRIEFPFTSPYHLQIARLEAVLRSEIDKVDEPLSMGQEEARTNPNHPTCEVNGDIYLIEAIEDGKAVCFLKDDSGPAEYVEFSLGSLTLSESLNIVKFFFDKWWNSQERVELREIKR